MGQFAFFSENTGSYSLLFRSLKCRQSNEVDIADDLE